MKTLTRICMCLLLVVALTGATGCDDDYYYDDWGYYGGGSDYGSGSGTFCSDYGSGCVSWW